MTHHEHHHRTEHGHDWHSAEYVNRWIGDDVTRDAERAPALRQMLAHSSFPADAVLGVLDVGAGYGLVSDAVLRIFPRARVTLQDYSTYMLDHARTSLKAFADRTAFVLSDLTDPRWIHSVGGPFDLAVSAIAIHNLGDPAKIAAVYGGIFELLKPTGMFINSDYVFAGGLEAHLRWLREAGFARVSAEPQQGRAIVMVAFVSE